MIHVTNDWILKPLPNADAQPLTNYVNAISCECFEPLVDLSSNYSSTPAAPKYIESSTGIILPVYQPDPADVQYYWGMETSQWRYFATGTDTAQHRGCRGRYDLKGIPTTQQNLGYTDRYVDTNNYERKCDVAFGSSLYGEIKPVEFKFFDPDSKTYKSLFLRYTQEYKKYQDGSTVNKRTYPYRYSYFWEEENNTDPSKRSYIFESQHFNIVDGESYPQYGYAFLNKPMYIYLYTDIGFDVINEKWVGLLNLFLHIATGSSGYYAYMNGDTIVTDYSSCRIMPILCERSQMGPFASISRTSYADAVGAYSGLIPFYSRAFELEDFEPDIQNIALPMTKIGCYGPNTRISP